MTKLIKAIIVDIDGTVADLSHRLHFVKSHPKDHKSFYDTMSEDKPIQIIIDLILALRKEYFLLFVSGRPDSHYDHTVNWLEKHGIFMPLLLMRKADDFRKDDIIKKEILDSIRTSNLYDIQFVLDDRTRVVDMWRREGLICLQVAPGDFDSPKYANRPGKLVLLVGPSGAGKSTYVKNYAFSSGIDIISWAPSQVISTDNLREELTGTFQDQSKNEQVFTAVHRLTKARIESGLLTVIDATNLRNADRKALRDLVPFNTEIEYHVIDRPLKEKLKTGGWRLNVDIKGQNLVEKHDQIFNSNLKDILAGDNDPRVTVLDTREEK